MKTPTMKQFNDWSEESKLFWINYESGGNSGSPGTPGFIFYSDYVIRYTNDKRGKIIDPTAMQLEQATLEFRRANLAVGAMSRYN
jgi:hypothetical protein